MSIVCDKVFENIDYTIERFRIAEYDNCSFTNCNFSGTSLSQSIFIDCNFNNCNLSNTILNETVVRDITFNHCKMLGLHFESCSPFLFAATFHHCTLSYSSFYKLSIKKTLFKHCVLNDTDFAQSNLTESVFDNCDLKNAAFDQSVLAKVDFSTAYNYDIDPDLNNIKKATFSIEGLPGLLTKHRIVIK